MGSFNVACTVSRISLCPGMPIAYFPLKPYRYAPKNPHHLLIYPWAIYEPLTLPIFGEYDDYGHIDVQRDENVRIIENHFKLSIDQITGTKQMSMHEIFCHGMFVHRDIYQHMIDNQIDDFGKTKGHFVESRNNLNKSYRICRKLLYARGTNDYMTALNLHSVFEFSEEKYLEELYHPCIIRGRLRKPLVDFWLFQTSMGYANVHFAPAQNGYQCGNPYGNIKLHQKIVEILDKKIKENEEDKI